MGAPLGACARDGVRLASSGGEAVPIGGILSGKLVAVGLMNLANPTTSVGEDQTCDSWSSEETSGRKRVLAHALGGQERTV